MPDTSELADKVFGQKVIDMVIEMKKTKFQKRIEAQQKLLAKAFNEHKIKDLINIEDEKLD